MPRSRRDRVSPKPLRTPTVLPQGPNLYREPKDRGFVGGAGVPPPDFVGGNNSKYEWQIYRAIASVTGYPLEPDQPPYIGFPGVWIYQKAWDQGRREPGGSVIDFLVYAGDHTSVDTAFRVQTEYFHIFSDANKQASDAIQKARLTEFFRVVDLYDHEFAWDATNQAAVILVKRALAGETFPDPITDGTAERVRPNIIIG